MSDNPKDQVSAVLSVLAILGGVVELFYRPFGVGPVALLLGLTALVMSSRHRRLASTALASVGIGFLVGASIAIWYSHALY
jgi:hypothetical protein